MVSIYRRGNRLYLQYPVAVGSSKRMQRSTGLTDTPANRKLLRQKVIPALEAKIASGTLLAEIEKKKARKSKKKKRDKKEEKTGR